MQATVKAAYKGVKVFSATKALDRDLLGTKVSDWIAANKIQVMETVVTQSSDSEFHCLAITVFY